MSIEIELKNPFEYDGKRIEKVKILRKEIKVLDRIKAKTEAKSVFGTEEGDAFLICLINRLCKFGEVKIPSLELAEKLSTEDFDNIVMKIAGLDEDFLQSAVKSSES